MDERPKRAMPLALRLQRALTENSTGYLLSFMVSLRFLRFLVQIINGAWWMFKLQMLNLTAFLLKSA